MTHPDVLAAQTPTDTQTQRSYQLYFSSGFYDQRYPIPNRRMWRRILSRITPDSRVLDYGCGSGRYLFAMRAHVARAVGFDVSVAALNLVRARAGVENWTTLDVIGPDETDLDGYVARHGRLDVALCLFGVLGHITDPDARHAALVRIKDALVPDTGRLLISVPNRARRFRKEQTKSTTAGLVSYTRKVDGEDMHLNYHLFDPASIRAELQAAGFTVHSVRCESVLPESWLLRSVIASWCDDLLSLICPVRWGYGIVVDASC